jgi:hypothetical protein
MKGFSYNLIVSRIFPLADLLFSQAKDKNDLTYPAQSVHFIGTC